MKRRFLLLMVLVLAFVAGAGRDCVAAPPVVVLLRSEGAAFAQVNQAADSFKQKRKPILDLAVSDATREDELEKLVRAKHPEVIVAVGSVAAQMAEKLFPDLPQVLVATPRTSDTHTAPVVSVDANIPAVEEMRRIADILPDVQKIGILYDPALTDKLVSDLSDAANRQTTRKRPLSVVAIPVHSASEIPGAFKKLAALLEERGALLFVPDQTVISSRQWLTEQTVRARIPVIGFEAYRFIDNGAVLAFEPDYRKLGIQGAEAVRQLVAGRSDEVLPAEFETWVNPDTARKLGVRTYYHPDDELVQEFRR